MHLAKGAKGKGQEVGTGLGCDQVRGGLSVTSVIRWVTGGGGAEENEGRGAALRGNEARGAAGGPACGGLSPLCPSRGTCHPGSRWSVDAIESLGCGRALTSPVLASTALARDADRQQATWGQETDQAGLLGGQSLGKGSPSVPFQWEALPSDGSPGDLTGRDGHSHLFQGDVAPLSHTCALWSLASCSLLQPQFPVCQMGMATDLTGQGSLRL